MNDLKGHGFKILNGMGLGIVIALIPGAIFGKVAELLGLSNVSMMLAISTSLMCLIIGLCIALQFKLDPISSGTLAITCMIAGGAVKMNEQKALMLAGSGDVLNTAFAAALAVAIILLIQDHLKAYKLIVLPLLVITVVGSISILTLPISMAITGLIGNIVELATTAQPIIMSILLALAFGIIIVSPISTVAIALAIELSGNGSAAANIGITGVALTFAILSYKTNGLGTSLVHFLGSPKIQMANFIKRPIMIVPGLVSGMLASIAVPVLDLVGTPRSAGFGLSGLIGPLGHLDIVGFEVANVMVAAFGFIIIPTITSFICAYVFTKHYKLVNEEYYSLDIK